MKIILVACFCECITESSQHVINLYRPKGDYSVDWYIDTTAEVHCKSLGGGCLRHGATPDDRLAEGLKCVAINVRVRPTKQEMSEWLKTVRTDLELRSKQIGEQISLDVTTNARGKSRICRNIKAGFVARVTLQVHLYTKVFVPVVNQ